MSPSDIFLLLLCVVLFFLWIITLYLWNQAVKEARHEKESHLKEIQKLSDTSPKDNSQELSDFLTDVKTYGYGFTRVDPASVFLRSPRE